MKKILEDLVKTFSPSGDEELIRRKLKRYFKGAGLAVKTDRIGNIWGIRKGKKKKVLMIEAHMDEIALMVSYFEAGGFLRFTTIGGFDPKILPGTEVIIHGKKKIKGIISSIPPHLQTGTRTKPWPMTEIFIDTGLNDLDLRANVRIGDYISLPKSFITLKNSRVSGASLDNRIGVSLLVDIAQSLNKVTDFTIVFAATFGEEIGLRGGITSSYGIKPDIGICIDVSFGDFPGQPSLLTKLGSGPILSIGPVYHPVFMDFIKKSAKRKKIKFQHEIENRPGGTNAGPIQLSGVGIAVAGISIPIRNMHSPVEVADLNDVKNTSKLIKEVISTLKISILEKVKCY